MASDDMMLVREFAANDSEEAFATLVSRHLNLVYSVALRQTRDAHLAEEITQAVFIILARKANTLSPKTILSGWLCRTAHYASDNLLKIQRRRQHRDQEAHMQSLGEESESQAAWIQIAPLLDTALAQLGETDRATVVLRFYERRNFNDIGLALGKSEEAAKKRLNRAVEKLRIFFKKRGITLSAAAMAAAVSANSVQAAPIGLATSVTIAAVKGTAVTTSTLTLIKTTLKIMAWTKLKTAVVVGAVALLVVGTGSMIRQSAKTPVKAVSESDKPSLFVFAGYATPEATLQSFLWALSTGDLEKIQRTCTPEQAERFKNNMAGKSDAEVRAAAMAWANHMVGFQLSQKDVISRDEVRLLLRVEPYPGHPNVGNDLQVMKKIGSEWKYAGKFGVDIKEN